MKTTDWRAEYKERGGYGGDDEQRSLANTGPTSGGREKETGSEDDDEVCFSSPFLPQAFHFRMIPMFILFELSFSFSAAGPAR